MVPSRCLFRWNDGGGQHYVNWQVEWWRRAVLCGLRIIWNNVWVQYYMNWQVELWRRAVLCELRIIWNDGRLYYVNWQVEWRMFVLCGLRIVWNDGGGLYRVNWQMLYYLTSGMMEDGCTMWTENCMETRRRAVLYKLTSGMMEEGCTMWTENCMERWKSVLM